MVKHWTAESNATKMSYERAFKKQEALIKHLSSAKDQPKPKKRIPVSAIKPSGKQKPQSPIIKKAKNHEGTL